MAVGDYGDGCIALIDVTYLFGDPLGGLQVVLTVRQNLGLHDLGTKPF